MTILGATLLDVVIALIILISGILSWLRGFAEELVTILAWVVGLVVAFQFASFGAQFVPEMFNEITLGERTYGLTQFHAPVAGVVLFLLTFVLVSQLNRIFAQMAKDKDSGVLRRSDRIMGFLFGLLRGGLLVLVLVLIAGTIPAINDAGFWHESELVPYFVEVAQRVIEWMPEDWQQHFHYPESVEALAETVSETIPETLPETLPE
ncbi:MAG: CvpA family protein [Gammaproteobacteria bacterium]|nr:CvpA family protein [Gammaproteobacteria bacterium]